MTQATMPDWIADALSGLQCGDTAAFIAMHDGDAEHEVPLAPDGRPRKLVGKAAIAEFTALLPSVADFTAFDDIRAHDSGDELIVEFTGGGTRVDTGERSDSHTSGCDPRSRTGISSPRPHDAVPVVNPERGARRIDLS